MARFSNNTTAGAGLGVAGIVPQRSIPIDMESALGHVWWQLGTYEANVVVVDGVVVTWYHHRSWRRLTRDAWILTHVTVVPCFLYISGLDVEKDVSLLAENRPDVTDSHRGVIHLIPLTIACLNVAKVVSSMTAESRVDQHSIEPIDLGLPLRLRHEGPQVQVLWIFHILCNFASTEVCKRLSERVSTLELRWMVNLFEAVTIFLHLVHLYEFSPSSCSGLTNCSRALETLVAVLISRGISRKGSNVSDTALQFKHLTLDLRCPPNTWWMKVVACVCLSNLVPGKQDFCIASTVYRRNS